MVRNTSLLLESWAGIDIHEIILHQNASHEVFPYFQLNAPKPNLALHQNYGMCATSSVLAMGEDPPAACKMWKVPHLLYTECSFSEPRDSDLDSN